MTKQLLIYETAVPLSSARHRMVSVEPQKGYGFSAGVNAVPLMAAEFLHAAAEYVIVFTAAGDEVVPAVVLGVHADQNLYLSRDSQWQAKYIPAFIRRYPFVFSTSTDGKTLTLCIDESHPGLNREGRGQRLFGDNGEPAPYVDLVLKFLQEYQLRFERTRQFGQHIRALGLLEPMQARVATPDGGTFTLSGFLAVDRAKLRALDSGTLASLARTDELELLYVHLHSMRNFDAVRDRLVGTLAASNEAAPAVASSVPAEAEAST